MSNKNHMPKISDIRHSQERRISLLIGRTEFVTSEKFRIYFSRRATGVQENDGNSYIVYV